MKAIETYYNGYRFRSRLEARWAVFLDSLGVEYEYEPEGFDLGDGTCYLPDFRVICHGMRGENCKDSFPLWIEVKGEMSLDDADKIIKFSCENPILVVGKIPPYGTVIPDPVFLDEIGWIGYYSYQTIDGDYFGAYPAADSKGHFYLWGADSNYVNREDFDRVKYAYDRARQARFEFGEHGA